LRFNLKANEVEQKFAHYKTNYFNQQNTIIKLAQETVLKLDDLSDLFQTSIAHLIEMKKSINKCATKQDLLTYFQSFSNVERSALNVSLKIYLIASVIE
jgi:hypothetical protein